MPGYFGSFEKDDATWIIIQKIDGIDLRDMTDDDVNAVADILAKMQNAYWTEYPKEINGTKRARYDTYIERINKRNGFLTEENIVKKAYLEFVQRQHNCPVTLSNGDLMQFNVMRSGERRYIVDWGFGGMMPYSLDIARFIAHATEDRATFPFYMNDDQKRCFINRVYDRLNNKPDYDTYLRDIELAILNEYVEFVEANEDEDNWYYDHAVELAQKLMEK